MNILSSHADSSMKILSLILSSLLFLSACSGTIPISKTDTRADKILQLEQENIALKLELSKLREDNILLQAWGDPSTINTTITEEDPSAPKFIEWSFASCMKEAQETYINQGTQYCRQWWYSTGDILADRCKLDNGVAEQLKSTKAKMEIECQNLYQ